MEGGVVGPTGGLGLGWAGRCGGSRRWATGLPRSQRTGADFATGLLVWPCDECFEVYGLDPSVENAMLKPLFFMFSQMMI